MRLQAPILFGLFLWLSALVGCSSTAPSADKANSGTQVQAVSPASPLPFILSAPGASKDKPAPIPTTELNLKTQCSYRDPGGYQASLTASVSAARVQAFKADMDVPKRGSCHFDLTDFEQTDRLPIVVLKSRRTACKVSMWSQKANVTVAFTGCEAHCSGSAADYVWPIVVNKPSGQCS